MASGAVYNGDRDHIDFVSRVYALHSQVNPLHPDLWPSAAKFEAEIVAMTAHMLNGDKAVVPVGSEEGVCGSVTSGGSESILLAMKTYRDWARATKGITEPELVVPVSAHAAFHKAAQYFGLKLRVVPLDADFCVDLAALEAAVNEKTIAIVGSACNFPYGTIDPIESLSAIAKERGVGLHVDGCLGGFFLPWAERLGQPVPTFDFRLPGVTSISCDTHKYGYAPKGTSVVLYRGAALRRFQYFTTSDWPGGLYYSPTFSGSRPGGLSAACWAALVSIGEQGYLEATRRILDAVAVMKQGVADIPELRLMGRPDRRLCVHIDQRQSQYLPGPRPHVGKGLEPDRPATPGRHSSQPDSAARATGRGRALRHRLKGGRGARPGESGLHGRHGTDLRPGRDGSRSLTRARHAAAGDGRLLPRVIRMPVGSFTEGVRLVRRSHPV